MYEEFLKLLNLFSKDVLDLKILVERARVFLGDGDLMAEFKDLVGWDFRRDHVEHGPPGSIRTGPPEGLPSMIIDEGQGPSYRRVPESVSAKSIETRFLTLPSGDPPCLLGSG